MTKLNKDWVVGFVDGEGCFYVGLNKNQTLILGEQVLPEFKIVQHQRDLQLLYKIKDFFKCGIVKNNKGQNSEIFEYRVRNVSHLDQIIIPFFKQNLLQTQKKFNFNYFSQIVNLMINKQHLTESGLIQIKSLKNKMNRQLEDKDIVRS